jgi:hypothetical protein
VTRSVTPSIHARSHPRVASSFRTSEIVAGSARHITARCRASKEILDPAGLIDSEGVRIAYQIAAVCPDTALHKLLFRESIQTVSCIVDVRCSLASFRAQVGCKQAPSTSFMLCIPDFRGVKLQMLNVVNTITKTRRHCLLVQFLCA